jgi:hypothetical protein
MNLEEVRLDLAVRVIARSHRAAADLDVPARLASLREAYATLQSLDAGDEDWSIETTKAAWDIVAEAYPRGGDLGRVLQDLALAHQVVLETASAPPASRRSKPRRDA